MKPDLTLLYSELGLKPNCTLAELQLAYRRRISELQPRRLGGTQQTPEASALLRDLIWLYTSATRFHRRYGRLPGAAPQRHGHDGITHLYSQRSYFDGSPPADEPPSRLALGLALVLLVLLFTLVAIASGEWLR